MLQLTIERSSSAWKTSWLKLILPIQTGNRVGRQRKSRFLRLGSNVIAKPPGSVGETALRIQSLILVSSLESANRSVTGSPFDAIR